MPWWRFWRPETEAEKHEIANQKAAKLALETGDIPPSAKERINEFLSKGGDKFFSSDLSVREFLLTQESGIKPISQVMGTAFFNVSYWGSYMGPFRRTGELEKITHGQMEARSLAMSRMKIEAKLLGASGVIGVRLISRPSKIGNRMTEFICYGTAVHVPGYPPTEDPFTSHLNGQEFWQLYKAGCKPRDVVMGSCSYYIYTTLRAFWQQTGFFGIQRNQEVDLYTKGFIDARLRALDRMRSELSTIQADGAVGVTVGFYLEKIEYEVFNYRQIDLLVTFTALGTAIDYVAAPEPSNRLMVMDLKTKKTFNVWDMR